MNFLSFFKRNNDIDSFVALKYNIPNESCASLALSISIRYPSAYSKLSTNKQSATLPHPNTN